MLVVSFGFIPAFKDWKGAKSSRVVGCMADAVSVEGYGDGAYIMHMECVGVLRIVGSDLGPDSVVINELANCIYIVDRCC
jgi:hypothetical protein